MFFRLRRRDGISPGESAIAVRTDLEEHETPLSLLPRPPPRSSNPWLQDIVNGAGRTGESNLSAATPSIQRVPALLRENKSFMKHYNPMLVSLGPYHHGKPELEPVQKFKLKVAREFVTDSSSPVDAFYDKVAAVPSRARNCYAEGSTDAYSDEAFAQMMFLDGCFILHMIDCVVHDKLEHKKMIVDHLGFLTSTMVIPELFLLENQIPLFVLHELMSLKFQRGEGEEIIRTFSDSIFGTRKEEAGSDVKKQPLHLLELLRAILLQGNGEKDQRQRGIELKKIAHGPPKDDSYSFCSVGELKAKGIRFKPSSRRGWKNIEFESHYCYGQLTLPMRTSGPQTKQLFLNLMTYEMCPNTPNDMGITTYIYFMKSLIYRPEDVTELRSRGILHNFLCSDEEVVEMLKDITAYTIHNTETYRDVREGIQRHCNSKMRTWIAEVMSNHFRNP